MTFVARTPVLTLRDVTVLPPNEAPQANQSRGPRDEGVAQLSDGRTVIVWSGSQDGDNDVRFQIS